MSVQRFRPYTAQRYRLEAKRCKKCGKIHFPPRLVCDKCGGRDFETITLPEQGKILTYTIVRLPADEFKYYKPIPIAIVELENGVKIMGQVTDANIDEIKIEKSVHFVFRKMREEGKRGLIQYSYKFKLDE